MTNYTRGSDFERKVMALLTSDGYVAVRAAGSKGQADIWAAKVGQLLLVQVKRRNPLLPPAERVELVRIANHCGALPVVAFQRAPRKPVEFRLLTGVGPQEWVEWFPDEVAQVVA